MMSFDCKHFVHIIILLTIIICNCVLSSIKTTNKTCLSKQTKYYNSRLSTVFLFYSFMHMQGCRHLSVIQHESIHTDTLLKKTSFAVCDHSLQFYSVTYALAAH